MTETTTSTSLRDHYAASGLTDLITSALATIAVFRQHVAMNVEDRSAPDAEVHRVLACCPRS